MLYEFLLKNKDEILDLAEKKTLKLTGTRPTSEQLKKGQSIFFEHLLAVLLSESEPKSRDTKHLINTSAKLEAASQNDEPALALAEGRPLEVQLAISAGSHGSEFMRLGYSLSHVVHAYGSICESTTELASAKNFSITSREFHNFNRCLDIAIAGAVTKYEQDNSYQKSVQEIEKLGFLAHELRNALTSVNISLQMIKRGTVGFAGSTGKILDRGLIRIEELITQSLSEVKQNSSAKPCIENDYLIKLLDEISLTASIEAGLKNQTIDIQVNPNLKIETDHKQLFTALSNVIQNAIKYTHPGGKIQVRGNVVGENIVLEVEDECGGLSDTKADLFKPFVQKNDNRKGLGLGLTIAQKAMAINRGTIKVSNIPGKGCIFKITLPNTNLPNKFQQNSKLQLATN
ncbi:MAG: HAMP domain-containing sensor histidine kinase [Bacteriovorax sp.]|nr:HAMP domain-containing sensor histidine kinase [Bacteriovorax sp.]